MPAESRTILMVDDDVDICHNLRDILGDMGFHVDISHSGADAIEFVRRRHYDIALLDLRMPGMDGLSLYRAIKELSPATVAIIITAYAGGTTVEDALGEGAWEVISKPVDFPRLIRSLDLAMKQPLLMVVDNDQTFCQDLASRMREAGYRVVEAHGPEEAKNYLTDQAFQVVLIEAGLPGSEREGIERLVRTARPSARALLVTGKPGELEPLVARLLEAGADAVCYKPLDVRTLLGTIAQIAP